MNKQYEKEKFYSQGIVELNQMRPNPYYRNYKLKETEQVIFEVNIDTDLDGEEVEIAMMNDVHLNYCNEEDEKDEEVMLTKKHRWWNANGTSVVPLIGAMDVAQYADQTVLAGDTLDFLSSGTMELTKKHVFDRDPNVLIAMGGHEFSKHVETGQQNKLPLEERLNILREFWIHDLHYESRVIKDKVICVAIDNSQAKYLEGQAAKLQADVERARKENKIILMFQHEPVCTGVPEDASCAPYLDVYGGKHNYYDGNLIFTKAKEMTRADKEVYEVLKNGADVIRGVFCGHFHSLFYNEITFETENGVKTIPQYTCLGNTYFGYKGVVTRIFVK